MIVLLLLHFQAIRELREKDAASGDTGSCKGNMEPDTSEGIKMKISDNYQACGDAIQEELGELDIGGAHYPMKQYIVDIVNDVISEANLPYTLSPFQKETLLSLAHSKSTILSVPTGSGKMVVSFLAHIVLSRITLTENGVSVILMPLNELMTETMCNPPLNLRVGYIRMSGEVSMCFNQFEKDQRITTSHTFNDMLSKVDIVMAHSESFSSSFGQNFLFSMKESNRIVLTVVDEAHSGLPGHWGGNFRPEMEFGPAKVRVNSQEGAPILAMTATLTEIEIEQLRVCLDIKMQDLVVIKQNPVLNNVKFCNIYRTSKFDDQIDCKGNLQPSTLKSLFLNAFIEAIKAGAKFKNTMLFVHSYEDGMILNDFLGQQLPSFAENEKNAPWFFNHSSRTARDKIMLNQRNADGYLPLIICTPCNLMGLNYKSIDQIVMYKPYEHLHDILQASGRGGRRLSNQSRPKLVFYLLFNDKDLSSSKVDDSVKKFCNSTKCLKETLSQFFGFTFKQLNSQWCCSSCDV